MGLKFENTEGLKGGTPKERDVVLITSTDGGTYTWTNGAGDSWSLFPLSFDERYVPTSFRVGEDCPYFGYDFY